MRSQRKKRMKTGDKEENIRKEVEGNENEKRKKRKQQKNEKKKKF